MRASHQASALHQRSRRGSLALLSGTLEAAAGPPARRCLRPATSMLVGLRGRTDLDTYKKMPEEAWRDHGLPSKFQRIISLWHLWKACIVEEMGELPDGFEEETSAILWKDFSEYQKKLHQSLESCSQVMKQLEMHLSQKEMEMNQ